MEKTHNPGRFILSVSDGGCQRDLRSVSASCMNCIGQPWIGGEDCLQRDAEQCDPVSIGRHAAGRQEGSICQPGLNDFQGVQHFPAELQQLFGAEI